METSSVDITAIIKANKEIELQNAKWLVCGIQQLSDKKAILVQTYIYHFIIITLPLHFYPKYVTKNTLHTVVFVMSMTQHNITHPTSQMFGHNHHFSI